MARAGPAAYDRTVFDPQLTSRPVRDATPAAAAADGPPLRGVIADWGGVMTNPITETVRAWIAADEIDYDSYHAVMKAWVTGAYDVAGEDNPIHVLERGECSDEEFERMLAGQIVRRDGLPVAAEGLLDRMFAATVLSEPMQDLLRRVRRAGLKTAMLSNSWGISAYPADLLAELFDAVVISAEVGMRKPEERIFRHATGLLGLEPGRVRVHRRHRGQRAGRGGPRDDRRAAHRACGDRGAAGVAARPGLGMPGFGGPGPADPPRAGAGCSSLARWPTIRARRTRYHGH